METKTEEAAPQESDKKDDEATPADAPAEDKKEEEPAPAEDKEPAAEEGERGV